MSLFLDFFSELAIGGFARVFEGVLRKVAFSCGVLLVNLW
jgi:hypothetical protein